MFPFLCTSHAVNPGKTFLFGRKSHIVLCVGSCVKGVTITHGLPWLTVCFYQLYHTHFDEQNCVALGYPSQALLLLEPFAKVHDTFSRFISLQLIIPVLRKSHFISNSCLPISYQAHKYIITSQYDSYMKTTQYNI